MCISPALQLNRYYIILDILFTFQEKTDTSSKLELKPQESGAPQPEEGEGENESTFEEKREAAQSRPWTRVDERPRSFASTKKFFEDQGSLIRQKVRDKSCSDQ